MGLFKSKKDENETTKRKSKLRSNKQWIFWGTLVSFLCAIVFSCFYSVLDSNARKNIASPLESRANISWLYQSSYLLYNDLYNAMSGEQLDYFDVYMKPDEEYLWILDERQMEEYMRQLELSEPVPELETTTPSTDNEPYDLSWHDCARLQEEFQYINDFFSNLENSFSNLNSNYDYTILDHNTGHYITNMSSKDMNRQRSQYFQLSFIFDSAGNVTLGDYIEGPDESQIRKLANEIIREKGLQSEFEDRVYLYNSFGKINQPVDCTVTFSIAEGAWDERESGFSVVDHGDGYYGYILYMNGSSHWAYVQAGTAGILMTCLVAMVILGMFLPVMGTTKPWKDNKICSISMELLIIVICLWSIVGCSLMMEIIVPVVSGQARMMLVEYFPITHSLGRLVVGIYNLIVLTVFFFGGWYIGVCIRALRELGLKEYIKQRCMIYRFFPFVKRKIMGAYEAIQNLDLTQDSHKTIVKLVIVNGVILFVICSLWVGGWIITIIYSILLYIILRKYISEIQKKYAILLKATNEIAEGNLNISINEDLGVFEPFKPQIIKIQEGFKKAVSEELKSQRMKAELITNVSHDLKTPLTAIITYVNLLKEENIKEENRKEYLDTLERKSMRLKLLIEDLFEVSKANSQNMTLNIMDVDIMNLVKQVSFEMADKLNASELDVRMNLKEEKVILPLDSQKTYRIYENLFANVAKYAMPGTRVYVSGFCTSDAVVITLKNISSQEITVETSELMERFVRNDASRNTDGSGLGLAIAKSFTELQGGQLSLEIDGDLFKVTTTWKLDKINQ